MSSLTTCPIAASQLFVMAQPASAPARLPESARRPLAVDPKTPARVRTSKRAP
jgi:hypothetical protein